MEDVSETQSLIVQKFFDELRGVHLDSRSVITVTADDIYLIASDISLRAEFREKFIKFSQDPEAKQLVIDFFRTLLVEDSRLCKEYESKIEIMDIYGARPCTGFAIGGAGALLWGAVAAGTLPLWGPMALLAGSTVGLVAFGTGRFKLSKKKRTLEANMEHVELLIARLEKNMEDRHE